MKIVFDYITSSFNWLVTHFGFNSLTDFINSMVHTKLLILTIPSSAILFGFVEKWFGFSAAIFLSFIILAIVELVTGLFGAKAKGQKIESRKFGRFGLKILVWLTLMLVANSFAMSYADKLGVQAGLIYQLFSWLHGTLVVYVSFEYLISILENLAKITGKSNNRLLAFLNYKLDQWFGQAKKGGKEEKIEEFDEIDLSKKVLPSDDDKKHSPLKDIILDDNKV